MAKRKLPQGIRKFIRLEKARIRRSVSDSKERKQKIKEFCSRFFVK